LALCVHTQLSFACPSRPRRAQTCLRLGLHPVQNHQDFGLETRNPWLLLGCHSLPALTCEAPPFLCLARSICTKICTEGALHCVLRSLWPTAALDRALSSRLVLLQISPAPLLMDLRVFGSDCTPFRERLDLPTRPCKTLCRTLMAVGGWLVKPSLQYVDAVLTLELDLGSGV